MTSSSADLLKELRIDRSARQAPPPPRGLWIGIELHGPARPICEALKARGLLCKEARERVIRLSPPLLLTKAQGDAALRILDEAITHVVSRPV